MASNTNFWDALIAMSEQRTQRVQARQEGRSDRTEDRQQGRSDRTEDRQQNRTDRATGRQQTGTNLGGAFAQVSEDHTDKVNNLISGILGAYASNPQAANALIAGATGNPALAAALAGAAGATAATMTSPTTTPTPSAAPTAAAPASSAASSTPPWVPWLLGGGLLLLLAKR